MLLSWQNSIVKEIVQRADHTRSYFLEVPDAQEFNFTAGQFVSLDLPIHERPSQRLRSYSIASPPNHSNIFELLISHKKGGKGSTYLFDEIRTGSSLRFRGPLGKFILPEVLDREICMICTGTGIAPFRSQVKYLIEHQIPFKSIELVFGARFFHDVLYYDELTDLARQYPQFKYHVTLSRDNSESWIGAKGYVHDIYKEICENGKRDFDFYLCGWHNMIHDAREQITQLGYVNDRIHLESYD